MGVARTAFAGAHTGAARSPGDGMGGRGGDRRPSLRGNGPRPNKLGSSYCHYRVTTIDADHVRRSGFARVPVHD